jgi:hypothetical protein
MERDILKKAIGIFSWMPLSSAAGAGADAEQYESQRQLLIQRGNGELLRDPQGRTARHRLSQSHGRTQRR